VLAIYALILNAIFGPASAGPIMGASDRAIVICGVAEPGHGDFGKDTGKQHEGCGACQGLCAHHGSAGIDPSRQWLGWLLPRRSGPRLEVAASELPVRAAEMGAARARAPPHLASSFA
jgi:hypothetical protein